MKKIILILGLLIGTNVMADPKSEVEDLMNDRILFGQELLEKYGEFYPYGGAITTDGEIISVAAYDGDDHPPSQEIIDLLKNAYLTAAEKGQYIATALFYDVRVIDPSTNQKTDAIAVELDHKENYSIIVFFPYKINGSSVEYGEIFAENGTDEIFKN